MHNVTFSDIKAIAENGIFVAGGPLRRGSSFGGGGSTDAAGALASQQQTQQQQQQGNKQQFSISGITIERVQLQLVGRSHWPGGCQDYRPSSNGTQRTAGHSPGGHSLSIIEGGSSVSQGRAWWPAGLDCSSHSTAPLWVAGAEHVLLSDVQVWNCCWPDGDCPGVCCKLLIS